MTYNNITQIKRANKAAGSYWFSPETLKWFNSKFPAKCVYPVRDGAFFISSEYSKGVYISTGWIPDGPTRWTLRFADAEGGISTVGEFQQYESLEEAKTAAKRAQQSHDILFDIDAQIKATTESVDLSAYVGLEEKHEN